LEREGNVKAPLVLRFIDRSALEQEHAENFAHGRAFVSGVSGYELFTPCLLLIEHPDNGSQCDVDVEVVMVLEEGVALQFKDRSSEELERVSTFIATGGVADNQNADALALFHDQELDLPSVVNDSEWEGEDAKTNELDTAEPFDEERESELDHGSDQAEDALDDPQPGDHGDDALDDFDARDGESELDEGAADDEDSLTEGAESDKASAYNAVLERQQRFRNLEVGERLRIARGPSQEQRVLLERIYGSAVWDALLRNPKITIPEVARIAKKGTLPRPLIDLICDNEQWIHQSVVRRALLANPRLGADSAMKVLRTLPQRELKIVPQQRAYPATVRAAAARLIKS
jgi:hypothetical protein